MALVNSSEKSTSNIVKNTATSLSSIDLTVQSAVHNFENNTVDEVDLSSYVSPSMSKVEEELKSYGFSNEDIKRIVNEEVTVDKLLAEIENDPKRKKKVMESQYLQNYKSSLVSTKDSKEYIKKINESVKILKSQKKELERNYDNQILTNFTASVKDGSSYDETMKKTAVWIDESGNKYYQKPVATREQTEKKYTELTYKEVLGKDNGYLIEFKKSLKNGEYTGTESQEKAYKNVYEISQNLKKEKEETLKEIDKTLKELKKQKKSYKENATDVEFDFNNLDELKAAVSSTESKLKTLREEKKTLENDSSKDMVRLLQLLKNGNSFDEALDKTAKWVDNNGNVYDVDPNSNRENANKIFKKVTYRDLYKNSEELKEIKKVLNNGKWSNNTEANNLYQKFNQRDKENIKRLKELEEELKKSEEAYSLYTSAYKNINEEVEYYFKNIEKYTKQNDFSTKNGFNKDSLGIVSKLKADYEADTSTYKQSLNVNDKDDITDLISCMINNQGVDSDGNILSTKTGQKIYIATDDSLYENMQSWLPFMTDTEKEIFNYVYNTKGKKEARKYLENISNALDKRYVADKQQKDQEFAEEHPVLATGLSIVKQPIEGMNAAYYSTKALWNNEKIRRTNVYSSSEIYRQQVAEDIAENYGENWAFLYNTGTSMADSGLLILAGHTVGLANMAGFAGKATSIGLSSTLMGSRSYVSTLNDALDRGLPDGSAVALAFSSSATESLMESYSAGHFLNLEGRLASGASSFATKFGSYFTSPALQNIATKTGYIALGALSQGFCEGEEEFATEIANYFVDNLISGDLSNHTLTINNYMKLGYTEEEARQMADVEYVNQLGQAFLGGFTSGVLFGAGGALHYNAKTSRTISSDILSDYVNSGKTTQIDLYNNFINGKYESVLDIIANDSTKTVDQKVLLANHLAQSLKSNLNLSYEQMQSLYEKIDTNIDINNKVEYNFETQVDGNTTENVNNLSIKDINNILHEKVSIKKAILSVFSSLPVVATKTNYTNVTQVAEVYNKIKSEGLYHLTSESNVNAILSSGYIKESSYFKSYGAKRSFAFAGIPSVESACLNSVFDYKTSAVKLTPKDSDIRNLECRNYSDYAVSSLGNMDISNMNAQPVYLVLKEVNNELKYVEVSKSEYDSYTVDFDSGKLQGKLQNAYLNLNSTLLGMATDVENFASAISKFKNKVKTNNKINNVQNSRDFIKQGVDRSSTLSSSSIEDQINKINAMAYKGITGTISLNNFEDITYDNLSSIKSTDNTLFNVDGKLYNYDDFVSKKMHLENSSKMDNIFNKYTNNTNANSEKVVNNQAEFERSNKINRLNELKQIIDSSEYQQYMKNAKNAYAQVLRQDFENVEAEYNQLLNELNVTPNSSYQNANNNQSKIIKDIEYAMEQLMNKYGYTKENAFKSVELALDNEDFSFITSEGNARKILMGYKLSDLRNAYNQLLSNDLSSTKVNKNVSTNMTMDEKIQLVNNQSSNGKISLISIDNVSELSNGVFEKINNPELIDIEVNGKIYSGPEFQQLLKEERWKNAKNFSSKMEVCEYFGDVKQYMYHILIDAAFDDLNPNQKALDYYDSLEKTVTFKIPTCSRLDPSELFEFLSQNNLLTNEQYAAISKMTNSTELNNSISQEELDQVFLFTAHLGPALAAYNRNNVTRFKGVNFSPNEIDYRINQAVNHHNNFNNMGLNTFTVEQLNNTMDNLIKMNTLKEDIIVERGVNDIFLGNSQINIGDLKPGMILTDSAHLSTSVCSTNMSSKHQIIEKILIPKGTPAAYIEQWGHTTGQQELLLDRNTHLEVVGMPELNESTGQVILKMQVVPNSAQFGYESLFNTGESGISYAEMAKSLKEKGVLEKYNESVEDIHNKHLYDNVKMAEHGYEHVENVLKFAMYMSNELGLNSSENEILVDCVKFHDVGLNISTSNHALNSANIIEQQLANKYSKSSMNLIKAIVEYHEMNDSDFYKISNKYGLSNDEQKFVLKISNILKDADALDRTRFPGNLDARFFRNKDLANSLVSASYQLRDLQASNNLHNMLNSSKILPEQKDEISNLINKGYPSKLIEFAMKYKNNFNYSSVEEYIKNMIKYRHF